MLSSQSECSPCSKDASNTNDVTVDLSTMDISANLWRLEDIFSALITNKTNEPLDVILIAKLCRDENTSLVEFESNIIELKVGFEPEFIYSYNLSSVTEFCKSEDLSEFVDLMTEVALSTGSLPAGNYTICVDAVNPDDITEVYGSDCVNQYISHPYPPELIMPANESHVREQFPIFSWLPPMPAYTNIRYGIEVVEILDGQTPIEAIESDFNWFYLDSIENINSIQYPIASRSFLIGSRYAWRIKANLAPESEIESVLYSPVWSFVYQGIQSEITGEDYFIELINPYSNEPRSEIPFFEWVLKSSASPNADNRVEDESFFYQFKLWKLVESETENNQQLLVDEPKLSLLYLDVADSVSEIANLGGTFLWQVVAIKDEQIVAHSKIDSFSIGRDRRFVDASEVMLDSVELLQHSKVYGFIEALQSGVTIESEEPTDIESIDITSLSYLFVIDDEPYARFGHPVRYVLVDDNTKAVNVYNADWFPQVKDSEETWKSSGTLQIENVEIEIISREQNETASKPRTGTDDLEKEILAIDCGNHAILIDGGDNKRSDRLLSTFPCDVDSLQTYYKQQGYGITRLSQDWGKKNPAAHTIPVNPETDAGAEYLRNIFLQLKKHYLQKHCCESSGLEFDLSIYINANAIKKTDLFKIYRDDGSGVYEDISFYNDVFRYFQTLPQCVRLTFYVDACYSGVLLDSVDYYLKRGNYEILTAADANMTTDLPGCRFLDDFTTESVEKPSEMDTDKDDVLTENMRTAFIPQSSAEIGLAIMKLDEGHGRVELGDRAGEIKASVREYAEQSGRKFPNPLYASKRSRQEFVMSLPVTRDLSTIKEITANPTNSVNFVLDDKNSQLIIFSKAEGQIEVTITYQDGSTKSEKITSKRGDDQL